MLSHIVESEEKKQSFIYFLVGRGDLSEIGPLLLRVLATVDEQIPSLNNSLSLPTVPHS